MSSRKEDDENAKYQKKIFVGETAEELAESMAGQVPEEDLQKILAVVNSALEKQAEPDNDIIETKCEMHRTYEDDAHQERIILLKTSESLQIVPVLMHAKGKLQLSLGVDPQQNDNEQSFNLASDVKVEDGLTPLITIPYNFDNNDNEAALNKVIDFFLQKYAAHVDVEELDCFGNVVSGKIVTIK